MQSLKIICPNGHLGFAPLKTPSFHLGVAAGPDCIAADSGSDDVGPVPLGSDTSTSPKQWQRHDLQEMLLASRRLGVPMIIGSAGDTGANSRVDLSVAKLKELAREHGLKKFKVGYFYSEVDREWLRGEMRRGNVVQGLDGFARRVRDLPAAPPDDGAISGFGVFSVAFGSAVTLVGAVAGAFDPRRVGPEGGPTARRGGSGHRGRSARPRRTGEHHHRLALRCVT